MKGALQPETSLSWKMDIDLMSEIDESQIGQASEHHALHRRHEWTLVTKIGGERDHAARRKGRDRGRNAFAHQGDPLATLTALLHPVV